MRDGKIKEYETVSTYKKAVYKFLKHKVTRFGRLQSSSKLEPSPLLHSLSLMNTLVEVTNLPVIFKVGTESRDISIHAIQYINYDRMRQSWHHPSIIRTITSKYVALSKKHKT